MDDEFSEFLLNDCLISGRLSPGPSDDFLGHGQHDLMLLSNHGHNGEVSNYLPFETEPDLGYSADFSRRHSTAMGSTLNNYEKSADKLVGNNGHTGMFAYIKTEESTSPLSPSSRSPDHDYIHDMKMDYAASTGGHGSGSICSSKTASSAEYSIGAAVGERHLDERTTIAEYNVDDYYCNAVETKPLPVGDAPTTIVASACNINGGDRTVGGGNDAIVHGGGRSDGGATLDTRIITLVPSNRQEISEASADADAWSRGFVIPKEEDAAPGDDNSSTTSGDSCSNCGYLSSISPAPSQFGYSPHHQTNSRYRPIAPSPNSVNMNMNLRTRSKMHELALKHNLISDQDPRAKGYVILSAEERRTLIQEGLPVPSKLPLSKQEEEALKIVRRKIKNKLSAQESRRKRKEYMETLEQQIEGYQSENSSLRRRIDALEKTNQSLVGQLKKLQHQFSSTSPTTATALVVGNGHDASAGDQPGSRAGSNVHHTVSLAAVFLLFAIMIPAMPVWPSIFQNAFITNPMMSRASKIDQMSSLHFDHSTDALPQSRVLWAGNNGDCDIPYSADYFEKLHIWTDDEINVDHENKDRLVESRSISQTAARMNSSDQLRAVVATAAEYSTAACETLGCREAISTRETVANA